MTVCCPPDATCSTLLFSRFFPVNSTGSHSSSSSPVVSWRFVPSPHPYALPGEGSANDTHEVAVIDVMSQSEFIFFGSEASMTSLPCPSRP
uniref:Uncharacterized protein n=1 Tax=Ciona intestinalis TaxID=7719 RepID=H2Y161_CIOIN